MGGLGKSPLSLAHFLWHFCVKNFHPSLKKNQLQNQWQFLS